MLRCVLWVAAAAAVSILLCSRPLVSRLCSHARLLLLGIPRDLFLLSQLTCDERSLILPPPPQFGIHPTPKQQCVCVCWQRVWHKGVSDTCVMCAVCVQMGGP